MLLQFRLKQFRGFACIGGRVNRRDPDVRLQKGEGVLFYAGPVRVRQPRAVEASEKKRLRSMVHFS